MGAAGRRAAPAFLFAALVVVVFWDPLFTGRNFSGRDLVPYNLPLEKSIHSAYASGHMPIWSPFVSGGRPLLPNPNAGAMYPVRPLLALLPFETALRIYPVLHWTLAGLGILVLLRSIGLGVPAAWIGAATYAFSGVSFSESFYPHILPGFMLLPWILWAFRREARSGVRGAAFLGMLFGLDFLAGDVFTSGLAIGICLLWLVTEMPPALARGRAVRLAAAVALGALLAAPQIVATAAWIPLTNRSVLGMKVGEAILFSVSPWRLLELIVPYPFGATWELRPNSSIWAWKLFNGKPLGLFSTLYVGALAPMALMSLHRNRLAGLRFARWLLALGMAVSILPSVFPASWRAWSSPLPLRNPEKLVIAAVLALAIFAARGFEYFRENRLTRGAALGVGAALALAAGVTAIWPDAFGRWAGGWLGLVPSNTAAASAQLPAGLSEAGILWMATVVALELARARRRPAAAASLCILTLVPLLANRKLVETSHPADIFAPTAFARTVRRADPNGSFRILGEEMYRDPGAAPLRGNDVAAVEKPRRELTYYTSSFWNLGTVLNIDFDSGDLARVESLRKVSALAASFQDSSAFFANLSLKWAIRNAGSAAVSSYRRFGGDAIQSWDDLAVAYPDLRLATRWKEEAGPLEALHALPGLDGGELLLETGRAGTGTARPGTVRILEKTPGRLRLDCETPDPTWLFVLRDFWPYRSVSVDGRDAEPVPAYLAFSAIAIPAGRHLVDWREEIPGIGLSRLGPLLFFAFAGIALARNPGKEQNRPDVRTDVGRTP